LAAEPPAVRQVGQVQEDVGTLGRGQRERAALGGPLEEPAVAAEHRHRPAVVPGQLVDPRVRPVEQPHADPAGFDLGSVADPAVDEHDVAKHARLARHHRARSLGHAPAAHLSAYAAAHGAHPAGHAFRRGIDELVALVERPVLQDAVEVRP
jgi:hypothetical protein